MKRIKQLSRGTKPCYVVKADAYNLCATKLALATENNVSCFAVAYCFEGKALRKCGITKPIIALLPPKIDNLSDYSKYKIEAVLSDFESLAAIQESNKDVVCHLAVNVGMNRFGVDGQNELERLYGYAKAHGITVKSVFTHLSQRLASEADEIVEFGRLTENIACQKHIFSSFQVEKIEVAEYNQYRVGLLPLGVTERSDFLFSLRFTAEIIFIRNLKSGAKLSYGGEYTAENNVKIAVVALGYADGFSRRYNGCFVRINGKRVRIVGNICMDVIFCDVTDIDVNIGDEAEIFSTAADLLELARNAEIAPHEVICSIGKRVERKYIYDKR